MRDKACLCAHVSFESAKRFGDGPVSYALGAPRAKSGFSRASSQGLRGLRIGALRIGGRYLAISRLRTLSSPAVVGRFGICAKS
eukprot:6517850-Alexandrium_andersonii.AAC.1